MKKEGIIVMFLLFLNPSVHLCFSQNTEQTSTPIPSFAEKYNMSFLGNNVFVFDQDMDMKEVQ